MTTIAIGQSEQVVAHAATATTPAASTALTGSNFYLFVWQGAGSNLLTSVGDSVGNTYTQIGSNVINTSDGGVLSVYKSEGATGSGSLTWNAHFSTTIYSILIGVEVTGAATSGGVDASYATYLNGGAPFSSPVTTTNANDLILGFVNTAEAADTFSSSLLTNSIQLVQSSSALASIEVASAVVSSTGTYNPNWSDADSYSKALVATLAIKAGSAPAGARQHLMRLGVR